MSTIWTPGGADPTRIDVRVDPREQRMVGVARHGNVPFDVPYISEIAENLWQGGCANGLVLPDEIVHVVSLYPWESYSYRHELHSRLEVVMYDSDDQGYELVNALAAWVNACRQDGPTLVHCQAGLNRSSLVAGRALMLSGLSGREAVALLREKRSPACLCNRSFESYLLTLDQLEEAA